MAVGDCIDLDRECIADDALDRIATAIDLRSDSENHDTTGQLHLI